MYFLKSCLLVKSQVARVEGRFWGIIEALKYLLAYSAMNDVIPINQTFKYLMKYFQNVIVRMKFARRMRSDAVIVAIEFFTRSVAENVTFFSIFNEVMTLSCEDILFGYFITVKVGKL